MSDGLVLASTSTHIPEGDARICSAAAGLTQARCEEGDPMFERTSYLMTLLGIDIPIV